MLVMENERLNFRLKDKDQQLTGKDLEFKTQLEKLRKQYEEKIIMCETKMNSIISENEKQNQQSKNYELQVISYQNQLQQSKEQAEKLEIEYQQWKLHYEKMLGEQQEQLENERLQKQ